MLRVLTIATGVLLGACGHVAAGKGGADAGVSDGGPATCSCDTTSGCTNCPSATICTLNGECRAPRYSIDTDAGTVTDEVTGLVWQGSVPPNPCPSDGNGVCTWSDAQSYCQSLTLGSSSSWRLPTLPELFSLVVLGGDPTIDAAAFPNTPEDSWFWTSSPYASVSGEAWVVYFDAGAAANGAVSNASSVRCVRSAESPSDAGPGELVDGGTS